MTAIAAFSVLAAAHGLPRRTLRPCARRLWLAELFADFRLRSLACRPMRLCLGERSYELTSKALVMGILNRTTDSFFDKGAFFEMDVFLKRAQQLVDEGADILDVGGVKAAPGPEVSEGEELDRVIPAVEALSERFDISLSVRTGRRP